MDFQVFVQADLPDPHHPVINRNIQVQRVIDLADGYNGILVVGLDFAAHCHSYAVGIHKCINLVEFKDIAFPSGVPKNRGDSLIHV
jgi:hypothetical protein